MLSLPCHPKSVVYSDIEYIRKGWTILQLFGGKSLGEVPCLIFSPASKITVVMDHHWNWQVRPSDGIAG